MTSVRLSIRVILATLLLAFSSQSLALFMPAGFKINVDTIVVPNDVGC